MRTDLFSYAVWCAALLAPTLSFLDAKAEDAPEPYLVFRKTGRILLDVGEAGSFDSTQAKYPCILRVGGEWWMWYNGRTDDRFTGSIGLAVSLDGIAWTKQNGGEPVFRHGPQGSFDATKVDHPAVLRFGGKFHMWYTAGDRRSAYTIGYAVSQDGIRWTRGNDATPVFGPGAKGRFDDKAVLHPAVVRDESGLLHLWYNGVGPQKSFRVGHATSEDGIHWTRQNDGEPVLKPSIVGSFDEGYVYNVFVNRSAGQFHMWYSAWTANDRRTGPDHNAVTHAVSSDGNVWKKDATPTITNGPEGSVDAYASFACCVVPRGDETWMYYSAGSDRTDGPYRVSLAVAKSAVAPQAAAPARGLFRRQYHRGDLSYCNSPVCVDFDNNGRRELLFASRKTKQLQMLNAADGAVGWSKTIEGDQQSLSAHDLDRDGDFEILYSVSNPGRLYVLDHLGHVLKQWDSGDSKLGNSVVVLDAEGDGRWDGFFGTRKRELIRLDMETLTPTKRRSGWSQCGCQTSAMDVDRDGRWDLFAGSGDDLQGRKGVLHRYDPVSLESAWTYRTDDNASSADAVLADIDRDGQVEIVKSVDNYAGDDAHDAVYAFETDGTLLWRTPGLSGEDSPNVADLDGDGEVEIVGMTFGCEVYCLDAQGRVRWRRDLRPELSDAQAHAYLTPILCDVNGDADLEILALTNGGFFDETGRTVREQVAAPGIVFALSAGGEILDQFAVDGPRYWGQAFVCNIDADPFLELIVSGSGGLDVIETAGFGPYSEHFQRRRNYQRLNVVPWAYEDSYFIHRGTKHHVVNATDNVVLAKRDGRFASSGSFTTELLALPPGGSFDRIRYDARAPEGTSIHVNVINQSGERILEHLSSNAKLHVGEPIRLEFVLSTTAHDTSPILDSYSLSFRR